MEYAFDTITCNIELRTKFVATTKRRFIIESYLRHYKIIACCTHISKAKTDRKKKFMACVLQVMLIVSIIDDTLKVTLVVTHLHKEFVAVFFHRV